ncbi:MAG: hypothetical protein HRT70_10905 [Flavobacteriaceae bacterium]|nr:hypothetical protein [Flavobacteriaceae bacterium]
MKKLIKISETTHARLKELAEEVDLPLQNITECLLESGLKRVTTGETDIVKGDTLEIPNIEF